MTSSSNPDLGSFEFPGYRGPQIRREICDWFRANGVDPNHLPADPHASVANGQLTFLSNVRSEHGGDVIAPDGASILTETRTVPISFPPSPLAGKWLAPKCTSCGR